MMGDLISRSALIERMNDFAVFCASYKPYMSKDDIAEKVLKQAKEQALRLVNEAPTVDAVPVVHASWIYGDFDKDGHWISGSKKVRCPECWRVFNSDNQNIWHWCPQCGAKMDGEKVQE